MTDSWQLKEAGHDNRRVCRSLCAPTPELQSADQRISSPKPLLRYGNGEERVALKPTQHFESFLLSFGGRPPLILGLQPPTSIPSSPTPFFLATASVSPLECH